MGSERPLKRRAGFLCHTQHHHCNVDVWQKWLYKTCSFSQPVLLIVWGDSLLSSGVTQLKLAHDKSINQCRSEKLKCWDVEELKRMMRSWIKGRFAICLVISYSDLSFLYSWLVPRWGWWLFRWPRDLCRCVGSHGWNLVFAVVETLCQ